MVNRLVLYLIVHRTALRYGANQLRRSLAGHVEIVAAREVHNSDGCAP